MVRRPQRASSQNGNGQAERSDRGKIIDALMALLAERPIEEIGFADIAARAGLSLAQCRGEFDSVLSVLAAQVREIDRRVLTAPDADMVEETRRERLFDVLMRRFEALAPYKAAVRSLARSARRNPALALALNSMAVRSQQWMLTAADIASGGPRGMIRAQGLALLYARVLRVWLDDDDPGLARTMAALDRELARGQRWSRFLDDLCRCVPPRCPGGRSRRRRHAEEGDEEPVAA